MKKIRFSLFMAIILSFTASAQEALLAKRVQLNQTNGSVANLLKHLGEKTGYVFSYNPAEVPLDREVNLSPDYQTVKAFLNKIFEGYAVDYLPKDNKILLTNIRLLDSPTITINGYLKDEETGETLIGANRFW